MSIPFECSIQIFTRAGYVLGLLSLDRILMTDVLSSNPHIFKEIRFYFQFETLDQYCWLMTRDGTEFNFLAAAVHLFAPHFFGICIEFYVRDDSDVDNTWCRRCYATYARQCRNNFLHCCETQQFAVVTFNLKERMFEIQIVITFLQTWTWDQLTLRRMMYLERVQVYSGARCVSRNNVVEKYVVWFMWDLSVVWFMWDCSVSVFCRTVRFISQQVLVDESERVVRPTYVKFSCFGTFSAGIWWIVTIDDHRCKEILQLSSHWSYCRRETCQPYITTWCYFSRFSFVLLLWFNQ